jgi:tetratricopeptide (TPR) repeat protein
MLDTMGQVYGSLGINDEASTALEKSLAVHIAQSGENNLDVANVLVHLAQVRISQANHTDAMTLANRAMNIQRNLLGNDAVELATPLRVIGEATTNLGNYSEGEDYIKRALSLLDSHGQFNSVEKGNALISLALVKSYEYQDAEAEQLYRSGLATLTPILGNDDPLVVQARNEFASVLAGQGKFSEAQPLFLESLTKKRQVLGSMHPDTVGAIEAYGVFLTRKGDYTSAQALLDEALAAKIKLYGEQHMNVGYTRVSFSILEFMRGNYAAAEKQVRTALGIYGRTLKDDNVYVAAAKMVLARILIRLHKPEEAIDIQQKARETFIAIYGADNPFTHRADAVLGIALVAAKRIDEARPLLLTVRPYIEKMTDRQEFVREYEDALAAIKR